MVPGVPGSWRARFLTTGVPRFRDLPLLVAGAIFHDYWPDVRSSHRARRGPPPAGNGSDLPGARRAVVGNRRPDRAPAEPQRRPARPVGGCLPARGRRRADPGLPGAGRALAGISAALAFGAGRLDPHRRYWPAGRGVPELLLHRRVAELGQPGHPGHHRDCPGHRAGRRAGPGPAPDRAARGLRHRPRADWPGPAGRPAGRWYPRKRGAGQRGPGGPRRHRVRHAHADQRPAGRGPGRTDRDRLRIHPRGPDPAAGGRGFRRAGLRPQPSQPRPAGRARHRPHGRGLHAVLPRPADGPGGNRGATVPARAAHRHGPGRGDPR
jgi:hypothetical protein